MYILSTLFTKPGEIISCTEFVYDQQALDRKCLLTFELPAYTLISGHPRELTPGHTGRIVQDFLTFVANYWPGMGALDRFCTSEARYTRKDLQDL